MTTTHDELVQRAREAIADVAGDCSTVDDERIRSLSKLMVDCESHIDTLCGEGDQDEEDSDWDDWDDEEDEDDSE